MLSIKSGKCGGNFHILRSGKVILAYTWLKLNFRLTKTARLWPTKHTLYICFNHWRKNYFFKKWNNCGSGIQNRVGWPLWRWFQNILLYYWELEFSKQYQTHGHHQMFSKQYLLAAANCNLTVSRSPLVTVKPFSYFRNSSGVQGSSSYSLPARP